jgi:hypothetical protein
MLTTAQSRLPRGLDVTIAIIAVAITGVHQPISRIASCRFPGADDSRVRVYGAFA